MIKEDIIQKRKLPEMVEDQMIEDIIQNFNFRKCYLTMKLLNWTWGLEDRSVPSIERLKRSAIDRLKNAIEVAKQGKCFKSTYFSSSGGLKASAFVNRYGYIENLILEFVLTEWESDGD